MMQAPLIECQGVCVELGGRGVLDGVDLTVWPGQIVGVVGLSGSGKSTLLRACVGLLPLAGGRILLLGEDLWALSEEARNRLRRRVGVVFQGSALFDSLTVAENVGFYPTRVARRSRKTVADAVRRNLQLVGLEGTEGLMPAELSGGMRKRVGIARALAMEPLLILYDEPTAHLDPVACAQLEVLISSLRDRLGMAGVVVSHDLASLTRISDRVVLLDGGRAGPDLPTAEFVRCADPRVRALLDAQSSGRLAQHG